MAKHQNDGRFKHVEEDAFQKRVDQKLQAKAVDPDDKSFGAYLTRFRCLRQPILTPFKSDKRLDRVELSWKTNQY